MGQGMIRRVAVLVFAAFLLGRFGAVGLAAPGTPQQRVPLVSLAARQIGVRQCLAGIDAVARRGTTSATLQDIVLNWDRQSPDTSPFFSLTGMGAATQRAALTITAVPTAGGNCALLVERISSGADNCATVAARELPPLPGGKLIDGIWVYQNPKVPEETYTLIQNPGSCIVIRRQAIFQWPPKP